jgi:hypothetical protein
LWAHGDVERREAYQVIRGFAGSGVQGDLRVGLFKLEYNKFSDMGPTTYEAREFVEDSKQWRRRKGVIKEFECRPQRLANITAFPSRAPSPDVFFSRYRFIGVEMFERTTDVISHRVRETHTRDGEKHVVNVKMLEGDARQTRMQELSDMKMPANCNMGDCHVTLADVSAGAKAFDDDSDRVPAQ